MAGQIVVRVVRALDEVEDLRLVWTSWQRIAEADIDLYLMTLRSTEWSLRPHIIVLYRDGSPQTMLIGKLENCGIGLKIGQWRLPSPRARGLAFIYGGLLGDQSPVSCEILMRSILDSLRGDEANFALLNKVRADSPLCQFAIESASPLCRDHFPSICLHCSVDLGGVEDFYQRLPKKTRHNLKWEAKKLLDDHSGQVKVFCFREPAELDRMIKDIEQVAKTTYQRSLGVGFKATPELFGRMVHEAREGRLRAYVLYVNEKPCAFWLGYVCHDILYVDCTGYDSSLRKYSPGKYLLMKVFEDSGREGLSKVDCGYGDEWYKEHFGTSQWSEIITYLFAPTRKGIGLNVLRTAAILTDRTLRWGLRRTALFPWIKRHWRNRLRRKVSIVEATG